MSRRPLTWPRPRVSRRNVLRGLFGASLGLPFLESLPQRSAWAADEKPVFSLFICTVLGVVPARFFPNELGPFTSETLGAAPKATAELARHAERLLFAKNVNWVQGGPMGEGHAESLVLALTARKPSSSGVACVGTGPSADWVIADRVQHGKPALTLYAGNRRNGYIAERLAFDETGQTIAAQDNPYKLYQELVGLVDASGAPTPGGQTAAKLLAESRKSVHDLVRSELKDLMGNPRLSGSDKQRLQHHFDAVRDLEIDLGNQGDEFAKRCSEQGLELDALRALETFTYNPRGQIEDLARLQMSLVALAFACNYNRTATLQWGDGTDKTIYDVPSNALLGNWPFSFISHRAQSDGTVGNNPTAESAHAEIDVLRMRTLADGLDHFEARGLADNAFVLWTNSLADGPGHSFRNVPHIIWGNGGGYLKQGQYVDCLGSKNNQMLNTLISAAIQDTGETMESFGDGTPGQLAVVRV